MEVLIEGVRICAESKEVIIKKDEENYSCSAIFEEFNNKITLKLERGCDYFFIDINKDDADFLAGCITRYVKKFPYDIKHTRE